jgi:hypothetical protein
VSTFATLPLQVTVGSDVGGDQWTEASKQAESWVIILTRVPVSCCRCLFFVRSILIYFPAYRNR